jgi:3-mercaptopyruvate sulfurtransferase SseA
MFAAKMEELGITNEDQLLVYDESDGQFVASARVWWTFRVFGHNDVKVLAGGLKNWPKGLQIQKPAADPKEHGLKFAVRKDPALVWSKYDMLDNLSPTNSDQSQVRSTFTPSCCGLVFNSWKIIDVRGGRRSWMPAQGSGSTLRWMNRAQTSLAAPFQIA